MDKHQKLKVRHEPAFGGFVVYGFNIHAFESKERVYFDFGLIDAGRAQTDERHSKNGSYRY